jgi:hypothetical protein
MPVHFHHPEAAAGLPRVTFASAFSRNAERAYAPLEMDAGDADSLAVPHHERRLSAMERVPSAPELQALLGQGKGAARAGPSAPKSWRRVDAAGDVTQLQARGVRAAALT